MAMSCYVDLSLSSLSPVDARQGLGPDVSPLSQLHKSAAKNSPAPPIISFRNVTFGYPSRPQHNCLKALNVDIFNQSLTVIAGASGAGKSSMMALMCALYKPTSGELSIAGKRITTCSDNDIKDLRKKVSCHLCLCYQRRPPQLMSISQMCSLLIIYFAWILINVAYFYVLSACRTRRSLWCSSHQCSSLGPLPTTSAMAG